MQEAISLAMSELDDAAHDDFEQEVTRELGPQCPRCRLPSLARKMHQHIEVDVCGGCGGIWLDRGELDAVMNLAILADRYVRDLRDDDDLDLVPDLRSTRRRR